MLKDIKGYEGLYSVDELGNVYSYPKKTRKGIRKLNPVLQRTGYLMLDLVKDKIRKKKLVHRAVAEAFIPNPNNKEQVNHINGNKQDNRVLNLEWSTRSENQLHSIKIGIRSTIGEKNSQSKLSSKNVLDILNDDRMNKDIAKEYNISPITVSNIKTGYSWNHITKLPSTRKI